MEEYNKANSPQAVSIYDLEQSNTDISVTPHVMTRGIVGRDANGVWRYIKVSSSGALSNDDAANFRVSALGVTVTPSPLSADSSSVSAVQASADKLRVSAIQEDAGKLRISAIGVSVTTSPLSADSSSISAIQGDAAKLRVSGIIDNGSVSAKSSDAGTFIVSAKSGDANSLHTSAFVDSGSISAKSGDANQLHTSAVQGDAALLRISAIGGTTGDNVIVGGNTQSISADVQRVSGIVSAGWNALLTYAQNRDDAVNLRVSAFSKDGGTFLISASGGVLSALAKEGTAFIGNVSAKNTDAVNFQVSAVLKDDASITKFFGRVSALGGLSANQSISSLGLEGTAFLGQVSATLKAGTANIGFVSAKSEDAALLRMSAIGTLAVSSHEVKQSDAVSLNVSAKSNDAGLLRVSAYSDDASKFRVYVVSGSAGGISANQSLSALGLEGTAHIGQVSAVLVDDASITKFLGRVSALGVTVTPSPLSADSSSISAVQGAADKLRVSAFSDSAALFRVSAFIDSGSVSAIMYDHEYGEGPNVVVSARSISPASAMKGLVVTNVAPDAAFLRVSSIQDGAAALNVSAKSDSAATFRVSALGVTLAASQSLSSRNLEGTAFMGSVSSNQAGTWAISSLNKEGTAFMGQVSAILKDGGAITQFLGRVSAIQEGAGNQRTSAFSNDGGLLRVSSVQTDGANQRTSCFSNDGALLRVSAIPMVDTVGRYTVFRSLSLSASQAVKGAAGAVYGYYLFNTTTVPQYVKMTNTSGAINVGTDVPIMTVMIPASAAANLEIAGGVKGFTAGIGIHATSAIADNATTPAAASAVGGNILYV